MVNPVVRSTFPLAWLATTAAVVATVPAYAGAVPSAPSSLPSSAQTSSPSQWLAVGDLTMEKLAQRLFPQWHAIGMSPSIKGQIQQDEAMKAMLKQRLQRRVDCEQDVTCLAAALIWTKAEIAIAQQAAANSAIPHFDDGVAPQMERELLGVNNILQSYGLAVPPLYPKIDGSGLIAPDEQRTRLQAAALMARTPRHHSAQLLDPSIDFALALLDNSNRTDAIGFDPISEGPNAAAFARAKKLDWGKYQYSAMIVTGVGPEVDNMPVSPLGKYHLRLAANRFSSGEAPFIILSGGRAHPRATPYVEAIEMRDMLIQRYKIPADAIIIEPYARHTTTNLRNASRLLMAMKAPMDMNTLIICNQGQSAYIESQIFAARNITELGYQPGHIRSRLSPTELLFRPSHASARIDPRDPLDP